MASMVAGVAICSSFSVIVASAPASAVQAPRSIPPYTGEASGSAHTCGFGPLPGQVKCSGANTDGQLGRGFFSNVGSTPGFVVTSPGGSTALGGVIAISAGGNVTCVLKGSSSANTAYCWGQNTYGELGDGTTTNRNAPVKVTGFTSGPNAAYNHDVGITIKVSSDHTCEGMTNGTSWCWGRNNYGQLGNGGTTNESHPVLVTAGGGGGGGARSARGVSPATFSNTRGTVAIGTGPGETCMLQKTGLVWCWGLDSYGQLGNGIAKGLSRHPALVKGLKIASSKIAHAAVVVAGDHACIVTASGPMYCWGRNNMGQLGNGTTRNSSIPREVGSGAPGGHAQPRGFSNSGNTTKVAAVANNTCVVQVSGSMFCWGANNDGQLGTGSTKASFGPVATNTSGIGAIASVSMGVNFTSVLTPSGAMWAWGSNKSGQFGNGTTTSSSLPVHAATATDFNPDAIAVDSTHVWVANYDDDSVTELSASTGAVVQVISGANDGFGGPAAIASDGTHVWVASADNTVTELSASTGAVIQVISDPSLDVPGGIAVDGSHVWVANSNGNSVTEFSASSGAFVQVLNNATYQFGGPDAISSDGTHVWVANGASGSVTELSASTGAFVQVNNDASLDGPTGIVSDGTNVWVCNGIGGSVTELSASTGATVTVNNDASFNTPAAIALDNTHVWVANSGGNSVTELLASSGATVQAINGKSYSFDAPDAIASDGTHVWAANAGKGTVTELLASSGALVQVISE
jgi:alpha-tubulin suppressor-like RCC1 family protein